MSTATLENIAQQRKELVEQAAKTGKVDQAKFAELERQRAEIEANREFMAEVDAELDRVDRESKQKALDDHLARQVEMMDQAAQGCAEAARKANEAIEQARYATQRWKDAAQALLHANESVAHIARQAGRVPPQKSPGVMDVHIRLERGTGENAIPLREIQTPFVAPIPR